MLAAHGFPVLSLVTFRAKRVARAAAPPLFAAEAAEHGGK
jgi:hypothetical protein